MMKQEPIKIILVDDHQVVRDGLKSMLNGAAEIAIVAQAATGKELFEVLQNHPADVLILDIELPDISGLEICGRISTAYPEIRILILSMYTGEDFIFKALSEGAKGYLPKNTTRDELLEAIQSIADGKEYYSQQISEIMLKSYIKKAKSKKDNDKGLEELSKRELEVLRMLAEGIPNYEIAEKLFISIRTVESHKSHIMQKLEMHTTAELVKFAIRKKLIEI
ncbi:MAG: response regulator transcription factor [Bacteroidetes bacterium]|nr:response regulator transcription factor [Bacteroidota bacterium]